MTAQEHIKAIIGRVAERKAGKEIVLELEVLLAAELSEIAFRKLNGNVAGFKSNMEDAIEWAEMLFGLRETTHDPNEVRAILIQYLGTAAEIAGELQRR